MPLMSSMGSGQSQV